MRLIAARSLDELDRDEEEALAGWREHERRKDRRRRRRDQQKRRRIPDKRKVSAAPSSPRRARALVTSPDPGTWPADDRRPEEAWPEDATWPEEDGPDEFDDLLDLAIEELEGTRRRRFGGEGDWSRAVRMSRNLRIQAARGVRAAVMELRPGLYLVAEMPEEAVPTGFGFVPLLAPLMLRSARRAMGRHAEEPRTGTPLLPGPVAHSPPANDLGWADPADVAELAWGASTRRRP